MNPSLFLAQALAGVPADDIRDIHGVIILPGIWSWLRWVLLALLVLGLAWAGWAAWKRRRAARPAPDPLAIALEALERTRVLLAPETAREFSIAVSDAVRAYIEARFAARSAHAAHRTTEEFLHALADDAASPLAPFRPVLGDFLAHCDRAKFGRWALSTAEMEAMLASARTFLLDTRPQPEAKADAPAKP